MFGITFVTPFNFTIFAVKHLGFCIRNTASHEKLYETNTNTPWMCYHQKYINIYEKSKNNQFLIEYCFNIIRFHFLSLSKPSNIYFSEWNKSRYDKTIVIKFCQMSYIWSLSYILLFIFISDFLTVYCNRRKKEKQRERERYWFY